jgi:hypothetical protein
LRRSRTAALGEATRNLNMDDLKELKKADLRNAA